jgi:hypothetical protein
MTALYCTVKDYRERRFKAIVGIIEDLIENGERQDEKAMEKWDYGVRDIKALLEHASFTLVSCHFLRTFSLSLQITLLSFGLRLNRYGVLFGDVRFDLCVIGMGFLGALIVLYDMISIEILWQFHVVPEAERCDLLDENKVFRKRGYLDKYGNDVYLVLWKFRALWTLYGAFFLFLCVKITMVFACSGHLWNAHWDPQRGCVDVEGAPVLRELPALFGLVSFLSWACLCFTILSGAFVVYTAAQLLVRLLPHCRK